MGSQVGDGGLHARAAGVPRRLKKTQGPPQLVHRDREQGVRSQRRFGERRGVELLELLATSVQQPAGGTEAVGRCGG